MKSLTIIHLEDSPADRELLAAMLADRYDTKVIPAHSRETFQKALSTEGNVDLIISDFTLPSYNGLLALQLAKSARPEVPFIFFSGTIGEEAAVETLTQGATDYVLKHKPQKLMAAIDRALREQEERLSRRKAEAELKKSEEWFRALTENSLDVVLVLRENGQIFYVSPSVQEVFGFTPAELLGVDAFSLLHQDDLAKALHEFHLALENQNLPAPFEFRVKNKGGAWRWTESRGKRLPPGLDVSGITLNLRDVTEKRDAETKFLRAQRLESLGVLAGGIAHDLNNILSPVLMATELLKEYIADPEGLRMVDTVQVSAQRGADIVKQILSFARGVTRKEGATLDCHLIIHEVLKLIRGSFPKSIQIQTRIESNLLPVQGNPTELHQVLMNLCVNARDAMPEGGLLQVRAANASFQKAFKVRDMELPPGDYVRLTVADSGTGIPPEYMPKIFEPFFTTKAEGHGTGLGLPTVCEIIKKHGGALDVQTELGVGTTFHVFIPAHQMARAAETKRPQSIATDRKRTILLVDDETAILELTRLILEDAGHDVYTAADAVHALQIYRSKPEIDLVVTDFSMPVMDGPALIAHLRESKPDLQIICTTGQASSGGQQRIKSLKVQRILIKPYTSADLLNAVHDTGPLVNA